MQSTCEQIIIYIYLLGTIHYSDRIAKISQKLNNIQVCFNYLIQMKFKFKLVWER